MKVVKLSIREFALPAPRTGSLETDSGYGGAPQSGIEIHQAVQEKRKKAFDHYEAEVTIKHAFERGDYRFEVEGRMDGIFTEASGKVHIEEIKSSFSLGDLHQTLQKSDVSHPYSLQLLTYGYFYHAKHQVLPELSFHLVSSRNFESRDLTIKLKIADYDLWLDLRLDELVKEAILAERRSERRKKVASKFPFPFPKPRSGQFELIATIEAEFKQKNPLLVQAPTGLGKTVGVLYPALKESLARGKPVIYVTPKNSQHQVAEEAMEKFQEQGSNLKSLTLTAKTKLCFKPEPLCNPTYCEYAKDYYDKLAQNDLADLLSKKKKLNAKVFKSLGEKYQVCPFELQLEAVKEADTVICDYNYVFSARSALRRAPQFDFGNTGKPNLVIDEAHNLPGRAMSYYSPSLSIPVLTRMRDDLHILPKKLLKEALELVNECIDVVESLRPKTAQESAHIDPPAAIFLDQESKLRSYLSRYLDSDVEIKPKDPVLKLCFYWSEFTQILADIVGLGRPEFFTLFLKGGTVKITCCDASEMLKQAYDDFDNVVAFSATLKPFDYYAKLSGLESDRLKKAEFKSPFDPAQRKVLIIPQISTKFQDRSRNYGRIAETICRITALKPGNHLAFFPSFDFMEKVAQCLELPPGFRLICQERSMRAEQIEETLQFLKSETVPTLVFGVQGGVFSEGVDYPGKMVIGVFVVGPPLPTFDLERETMRGYYEKMYDSGFDYAYAYPAMAKAVQAAGRVIRSETDKGIIILMDARFLEKSYVQSMPEDWFVTSPKELVSSKILSDLQAFWDEPSVLPSEEL
ncbi:MAG: ATP-dependent DNA helicase [Bdellovibrionales bacterium]|nr:ATP-dependent DNA helicase [Oligoflexia bacterium]